MPRLNQKNKLAFGSSLPFYYGWIVVLVAFLTMAIAVNARTSFSLLFPPILSEFKWSRGVTAGVFSIGFIVSTLLTPCIGLMMDKLGPRVVLPFGAVLTSAGLIGSTISSESWHFYFTLGVLLIGGSVFMSYFGHTLFLPNWFDRKRGFAMGLAFAGAGLGAILLLPLIQNIILSDGWRQAAFVLALIIILIVIPINLIFQRHRPDELGLEVDGDKISNANTKLSDSVNLNTRIVDQYWYDKEWTLSTAMRTGKFWWLIVSFSTALYAWYAVQVHQTKYLIDVGVSAEFAAFALGLVGLTGVIGQISLGAFSDKFGREIAWTIALMGFILTYACLFLIKFFPSMALIYLMVGLQGFIGYGLASVFGSVPADLFSGKHYGRIFGVIGGFSNIGAAAGPWITGIFYDYNDNYNSAFLSAIILCLISILAMWLVGPRKVVLVMGKTQKINL